MKVTVHCEELNFVVPCADGNQNLIWLSLAAATRYGQMHFPHGFFVPRLVKTQDGVIHHPRTPINKVVKDGGVLHVELKKGGTLHLKEEYDSWHSLAFGPDSNKLTVTFVWTPGKSSFGDRNPVAVVGLFRVDPENAEEFPPEQYNRPFTHALETRFTDAGDLELFASFMSPPGTFTYGFVLDNGSEVLARDQPQVSDHSKNLLVAKWIGPVPAVSVFEQEKEPTRSTANSHTNNSTTNQNAQRKDKDTTVNSRKEDKKDVKEDTEEELTDDLTNQFDHEWYSLTLDWIENGAEKAKLHDVMFPYYGKLVRMFQFYSALQLNSNGNYIGEEEMFFFAKTLACPYLATVDIEDVFASLPAAAVRDDATSGFNRPKFLEAIIKLAHRRYLDKNYPLSDCVDRLLKKKVAAAQEVREHIRKVSVQQLVSTNLPLLKTVFKQFATSNGPRGYPGQSIKLVDFIRLVNEAKLYGDGFGESDSRTCFHDVQMKDAAARVHDFSEVDDHQESVIFVEFVEALCRVAIRRFSAKLELASQPFTDKLKYVFDALRLLPL
eukprot:GILJ01003523.1.p1 GENE.GILJ01003523.1~~GILJ01003523.1.p1  ORF type:complete len:550 (-),score=105.01 GILJ01003523.1:63-1712(-)